MGKENRDFFQYGDFRFVILYHTGLKQGDRGDHWDWMLDWPGYLELEDLRKTGTNEASVSKPGSLRNEPASEPDKPPPGPLLTFCSPLPPMTWNSGARFVRLPLHRRAYLDYQGKVSKDRGHVLRVAEGMVQWRSIQPGRLVWTCTAIDFYGAPFPDWLGASYCLQFAPEATAPDARENVNRVLSKPIIPTDWEFTQPSSAADWLLTRQIHS
jgi:hypothetical protein